MAAVFVPILQVRVWGLNSSMEVPLKGSEGSPALEGVMELPAPEQYPGTSVISIPLGRVMLNVRLSAVPVLTTYSKA